MKRRIILGAVCSFGVFTLSCVISPDPRTITYRVSGTAYSSNITYANATNGTTHVKSGVNVAGAMIWEETVTLSAGSVAYLSAQSEGRRGSVIVEILDGNRLIKRSESNGEYCVASVSD